MTRAGTIERAGVARDRAIGPEMDGRRPRIASTSAAVTAAVPMIQTTNESPPLIAITSAAVRPTAGRPPAMSRWSASGSPR